MDYRSQILTLAEVMSKATGRSQARISTIAAGSGKFLDRIRGGGTCSVDTYLNLKQWFSDNWPEGTPWPEGVDRPDVLPNPKPAAA